jgi:hypothetical protein
MILITSVAGMAAIKRKRQQIIMDGQNKSFIDT